jgi:hypothetical protein
MSTQTQLVAVAVVGALCGLVGSGVAAADPAADPGTVQTLTPSRPSTPALDKQFLADLTRAGIRITDAPVAVYGAHDTCAYLAAGHDAIEAVEQGRRNNPTMTRTDEIAYVDAAIDVYCPRYVELKGTVA